MTPVRLLLGVALVAAPGCFSPAASSSTSSASTAPTAVEAGPSPEPAATGTSEPADTGDGNPTKDCTLEVHDGSAWVPRGTASCSSDALHLVVAGDIGYANPILELGVGAAKSVCAERRCDLFLLPGDLMYGPGRAAPEHWKAVRTTLAGVGAPMLAVLGNHEWRHEPNPELKREAIFASDGQDGLVIPAPSYALRVVREGKPIAAVAGLDTDSVANPGPQMPGLGKDAFDAACSQGVPVIVLGHHPPTSQGLHHGHEAHVEKALRDVLARRRTAGCDLRLAVAGHDHDLQVYPSECEQPGVPPVVVSGVMARGYRKAGEQHLPKCGPGSSEGAEGVYVAGRGEESGFVHVELSLGPSESVARTYTVPSSGAAQLLFTTPL